MPTLEGFAPRPAYPESKEEVMQPRLVASSTNENEMFILELLKGERYEV